MRFKYINYHIDASGCVAEVPPKMKVLWGRAAPQIPCGMSRVPAISVPSKLIVVISPKA